MTYTLQVVIDDDRMFELLHRVMCERMANDLGFPEVKDVNGTLTCSYPGMPDYLNVQRFELGGIIIEKPKGKVKNARQRQE